MACIGHRFAGDPTNWRLPNHTAVEAMLRSSGLRVVQRPGHEIYLCQPDTALRAETYDLDRPSAWRQPAQHTGGSGAAG
jgi:hypothetical protein